MKKLFPIFVFALTMSGFVHSTDMRNVNWGMSIKEVKAAESVKPELEKENMLGFIDQLDDKQIFVIYYFTEGKLGKGLIRFNNKRVNKNGFIRDFKTIDDLLKKKYGEPMDSRDLWSNDIFKDDPNSYGTALAAGALMKFSKWELEKTNIYHMVSGENYKVSHAIEFSAKQLGKDISKKIEEKNLDKL
ncbi:hypothetical protein H5159_14980 [Pseudoalteromonas sp. SG43-1]|uniref:hypothetical protein n=1 Tax=Pseudoalteromonas sp. SG43-1 TaxID=2760971 RepID=UPI0016016ACD|nr:hypothetical protein [Pseudoalteromonas sp. SG43-1]MBB1452348.1 hypothetical protein [Pseudoalteromonas sp. SG43-1]